MRITLSTGTPAEVARPSNAEPTRGLVLLPDIGGLRPLFDDHARRLADELGWVVVAPEPWPGREQLELAERLESVKTLRDDDKRADLLAAAELTGCEAVGVMGFCMGGMYTLKAAGTGRFHRAVAFYGMIRVPEQWASPTQGQPLDYLAQPAACPTMAVVGTADPWTPAADVDALEAAGVEVVRYADADHGFVHDDSRPAHRPDDAADAWRRAIAFLSA